MGTTAIILCMNDSVANIAKRCREFLQCDNFRNSVVEGIGRDSVETVAVSIFNLISDDLIYSTTFRLDPFDEWLLCIGDNCSMPREIIGS